MRALDEEQTKTLFDKLAQYCGASLKDLISGATQLYNDLYKEDHCNKTSGGNHRASTSTDVPMKIDVLRMGSKKTRINWLKFMRGDVPFSALRAGTH